MTSPSAIIDMGIIPPSGVKLSCIEFTEPFDAAVVATAHRLELAMPKRTSLPSMLAGSSPSAAKLVLPAASAQ